VRVSSPDVLERRRRFVLMDLNLMLVLMLVEASGPRCWRSRALDKRMGAVRRSVSCADRHIGHCTYN